MKIIGHRGARGLAPENTIAALRKALELKVDEVEIDVRVTMDGVPVLIHDRTLLRLVGVYKHIAKHSLEELRTYKPDLAKLEEAISFVNRRTPLRIEVKPRVATRPIISIIERYLQRGWQPTDFELASFSQKTLKELQTELPHIQQVVVERFLSLWAVHRARQIGTRRLAMNQLFLWSGVITVLHRRGYELSAYALNNPSRAKRWQRYGLASVITDYPDRFKKRSTR